eukprot:174424-Hanusia_phi.AAC.1
MNDKEVDDSELGKWVINNLMECEVESIGGERSNLTCCFGSGGGQQEPWGRTKSLERILERVVAWRTAAAKEERTAAAKEERTAAAMEAWIAAAVEIGHGSAEGT